MQSHGGVHGSFRKIYGAQWLPVILQIVLKLSLQLSERCEKSDIVDPRVGF